MNCQREIDLLELLSWWVLSWEGVIRHWGLRRSPHSLRLWGWNFFFFFSLLFSRPGPELWQHQLFLRWQVRGRAATWGWHPMRRWKWGPSDPGQNASCSDWWDDLRGKADEVSEQCACMKRELRAGQTPRNDRLIFNYSPNLVCFFVFHP